MKHIKRMAIVLVIVIAAMSLVACGETTKGGNSNNNNNNNTKLTPTSITKLADIPDYSTVSYVAATYTDTTAEVEKLTARIEEKQQEVADAERDGTADEISSLTKIFAEMEATKIIEAMRLAGLTSAKMTKTVDYLAGEEAHTNDEIENIVDAGRGQSGIQDTTGWSFFDDWSYYEKLQDAADATGSNDNDADNVKRQYRQILGKVFEIGMDGGEFARVAVEELVYATEVVEGMAGDTIDVTTVTTIPVSNINVPLSNFDRYCRDYLDYDTAVYLRAFNSFYAGGSSKAQCIKLYGYYYDYNKTDYNSQSDAVFERTLELSHKETYTDSEWLEYVGLQRNNYTAAYRYSDSFYETFYTLHFSFQEQVEKHELVVYQMTSWNGLSYTEQMRQAIRNSGLVGQLNFTDWLWCYAGDDDAMKDYNQANNAYENGKNVGATSPAKYEGQFKLELEEVKMVYYILDNMTTTNLDRTLWFECYAYSAEVSSNAMSYKKDSILVSDDKKDPEEVTSLIDGLDTPEAQKTYATEKITALLSQLQKSYSMPSTSSNTPWGTIKTEIGEAKDYDYTKISSSKEKVEQLEDKVITMKYSCGVGIFETCPLGNGHAECTKDYDTSHETSKFVSNYQKVLRYMAGSVEVSFNGLTAEYSTSNDQANLPREYSAGYFGDVSSALSTSLKSGVGYSEITALTAAMGKSFTDGVSDDDNWWAAEGTSSEGSRPTKTSYTTTETNSSNQTFNVTYVYTFSGWYLDAELKFEFNVNDKLMSDLTLYAGYSIQKTKN